VNHSNISPDFLSSAEILYCTGFPSFKVIKIKLKTALKPGLFYNKYDKI
jgi:hypothetical protein